MIMATESPEALLWQQGRDDRGWLILCVPPGPHLEIIVTVVACESPLRKKKISIVRQSENLLKVYVNPEVEKEDEWDEWEIGRPHPCWNPAAAPAHIGGPAWQARTEPRDARWRVAWMASGHLSDH